MMKHKAEIAGAMQKMTDALGALARVRDALKRVVEQSAPGCAEEGDWLSAHNVTDKLIDAIAAAPKLYWALMLECPASAKPADETEMGAEMGAPASAGDQISNLRFHAAGKPMMITVNGVG